MQRTLYVHKVHTRCLVNMIWETCIKMPIEIINKHKLRAYIVLCKSILCDQVFWEKFRPEGRTEQSLEAQHKLTGSSTSGSSSHHSKFTIWHEIQLILIYRKCFLFFGNLNRTKWVAVKLHPLTIQSVIQITPTVYFIYIYIYFIWSHFQSCFSVICLFSSKNSLISICFKNSVFQKVHPWLHNKHKKLIRSGQVTKAFWKCK